MSDEPNKLVDEEVSPDTSMSSDVSETTADHGAPEVPSLPADDPAVDHSAAGEENTAAPDQEADEADTTAGQPTEAAGEQSAEQMGESAPPAEETGEETSTAEEDTAEDEKAVAEDATSPEAAHEEPAADEAAKTKAKPAETAAEEEAEEKITLDWYILKVQSNREKSISEALERRVKIAGLEDYFDQVIVPTEKVTEFKGGRKRVVNRKLYPGYIMVRMHINDDTWFLVRETPGIGDFTGSGGKPTPMLPHEVQRIVSTEEEKTDEAPKLKIGFNVGDRVKINEGTFENFEGEVSTVDEASGRITVMINIFGRSTPVELEYWQAEAV